MPDNKDTPRPSFRGVLLLLLAVVAVTLVARSLLADDSPVASTFTHQPPIDRSTGPAQGRTQETPQTPALKPAQKPAPSSTHAPLLLAPAPKPIAKLTRSCSPGVHTGLVTVVSYNIRSAHGPLAPHGPGDLQLPLISQAIRLWGADVVLLQEVDVNRALSEHVNEPKWLADDLGWHYAFGVNVVRPGNSRYGTAILSRYPILEKSNTLLPRRPGTQFRGLLHAVIALHGHRISLYDTHLQNDSASLRVAQMRAIAPIVAADPLSVVLGGDFNAAPDSPVVALARTEASDTWSDVGVGAGFTHPSGSPRVRVDYLFHRGNLYPVRADVVSGGFSDHLAVRATYEYTYRHGGGCQLGRR